jgi:hypothetical protein
MKLTFLGGPKDGVSFRWNHPQETMYFPKPVPAIASLFQADEIPINKAYCETYKYRCVAVGPKEAFYRFVESK